MKPLWFILALCALCIPVTAQSKLEQGNSAYANNEFAQAAQLYRSALRQRENPALAWYNLGNTLYQLDSVPAAISAYKAALREAPDFFRPYLNLGILYYNLGDMAAAITVLTRGRHLEPRNTQLLLILASAQRSLGDAAGATVALEQVVAIDSTIDDAWFMLYDLCRELGDIAAARGWLERYPDSGNRAADKFQFLGELEAGLGNTDRALYWYRRTLASAADRRWVRFRLTNVLRQQGNTLTALEFARESLEKTSSFPELALLAGGIAFDAGYLRDAEEFYEKAYLLGSADGLVGLQNLSKMYKSTGDAAGLQRVGAIVAGRRAAAAGR